jgi:hypothetical protein
MLPRSPITCTEQLEVILFVRPWPMVLRVMLATLQENDCVPTVITVGIALKTVGIGITPSANLVDGTVIKPSAT